MAQLNPTSQRDTIALVFKRPWSKYNAGDCAGFGVVRAHELVKFGVCRYAEPDKAKAVQSAASTTGSGGQVVPETAPATGARRRRSPS